MQTDDLSAHVIASAANVELGQCNDGCNLQQQARRVGGAQHVSTRHIGMSWAARRMPRVICCLVVYVACRMGMNAARDSQTCDSDESSQIESP